MTIIPEAIKQDLEQLTSEQLQQVADYIAFLKFREKRCCLTLDPTQLILLKTEFAEEDKNFAEAGMGDYADMLAHEDLQ